jgi:chromosome partitioning protein
MPHTIAVLSQKGGTGKTTTVRTLADALRRAGVAVLAIDLDPQGNLSDYLDVPPEADPTIADVLAGRAKLAEAIHAAPHADVVPANLSLAEAELMLGGKMGRELTLRRALAELTKSAVAKSAVAEGAAADRAPAKSARIAPAYEVILIDCPPSLGLLTVNALVAADSALITAEAQYFALQGVEQALQVIELARESLNPDLYVLGILLNLADMRTVHSREALASLRESFGEQVLDSVIRSSIAYAESAERAVSILDHRPDLGADYLALTEELLGRLPELADARGQPPGPR